MIFVDTSYWVALHNRKDSNHRLARELLTRHSGHPLLTSNHVVGETWTMLRRRAGFELAVRFLDRVERSRRLTVEHVAKDLETRAWTWLRRHDEREYSFVDATCFAMMTSRRVHEALAFDGDFSAAGFLEVR